MKRYPEGIIVLVTLLFSVVLGAEAQDRALVNTSQSGHAKLHGTDMDAVKWTQGFWADRFQVCRDNMVPTLWKVYTDPGNQPFVPEF